MSQVSDEWKVTAFALGELEGEDAEEFSRRLAGDAALARATEVIRRQGEDLSARFSREPGIPLDDGRRAKLHLPARPATSRARSQHSERGRSGSEMSNPHAKSGARELVSRSGGAPTARSKTPHRESAAVEEHPSSKLRRMQPLKAGAQAPAPPFEPLDRSMRPVGLGLAAKFAIMIGVTVAITSLIMAIAVHSSVSTEVDTEINEAGVRTTRILCGFDAGLVKEMGERPLNTSFGKLQSDLNEYMKYLQGSDADQMPGLIQELLNRTEDGKLPDRDKDGLRARRDAIQASLGGAFADLQRLYSSSGILTGLVSAKDVPGVINVMITDSQNKILAILDSNAGEVRLGKTKEIDKIKDVQINEGAVNGAPAREYKATLYDKEKNPVATVRLYLSIAKIDQVKGKLFTAMLLPLFISVLLGIGIAVFIAARVTKPIRLLISDINAVSRGDLEHETVAHSSDEIGVLAKAFDRMTQGLKAAHQVELEKKAAAHELTIAAEIQSNLLPKKIPKIPGYDISAYYRPSKEVGGDLYDFIQIDDENLAILIADVSGKGVPGSMIMTMARSLLRMEGERNLSTADTLVKTNRILARDIRRGMFVTCMYMILNVRQRTLLISSAGHNPLIVFRKSTGQNELVNPNGIALGFDKGPIFERTVKEQKIQLYPGDRFCTYTDGVPEAMSPEDEEFGDDRFYDLCKSLSGVDSNQFLNRIVKELDDHKGDREQHDDITLVTVRLLG